MREAIPGLDASLYTDGEGHYFWAINKDWIPPVREKRVSGKKSGKKSGRILQGNGEEESPGRDNLALW